MRRKPWTLAGLALLALTAHGRTQEPVMDDPAPARRAEPGPSPYAVTPQVGEWMVLAASYTGEHARDLAEQFVKQLRDRKVPAYIFDYADWQRFKEEEERERMEKANPNAVHRRRRTKIHGHCGVLIGGYKTSEDANKAMQVIKGWKKETDIPKVYYPNGEEAVEYLTIAGERNQSGAPLQDPFAPGTPGVTEVKQLGRAKVNPFQRSIVCRNPSMARQQQQTNPEDKVDPLWKELNSGEEYSLLKNRKNYTLVIKFYQGSGQLRNDAPKTSKTFLDKLGLGSKSQDILDASAMQAHELARFLRQYDLETFVLHMRNGSLVTVGGFDSLDDEQLHRMQDKLSRMRLHPVRGTIEPANDLTQPMPMKVPKL
jgi:hypothetical protein